MGPCGVKLGFHFAYSGRGRGTGREAEQMLKSLVCSVVGSLTVMLQNGHHSRMKVGMLVKHSSETYCLVREDMNAWIKVFSQGVHRKT